MSHKTIQAYLLKMIYGVRRNRNRDLFHFKVEIVEIVIDILHRSVLKPQVIGMGDMINVKH